MMQPQTPPVSMGHLPILGLVQSTYATFKTNRWVFLKPGVFPVSLMFLMGLWETPQSLGTTVAVILDALILLLAWAFWTFSILPAQRFILLGPVKGGQAGILPKLTREESDFAVAGFFAFLPLIGYAIWFKQPLWPHIPDLTVLVGLAALDGWADALYAALFCAWISAVLAFAGPGLIDGKRGVGLTLYTFSLSILRQQFSRLFAAAILVSLPVWAVFFMLRTLMYATGLPEAALQDPGSAIAWNLILHGLETLKVWFCALFLAILHALAYARMRHHSEDMA